MTLTRAFFLGALAVLLLATVAGSPVAAQGGAPTPRLVQQFNDWELYAYEQAGGKVCYVLSKPTRLEPTDRDHGDVFFFVTARPGDRVSSEASILVGYEFQPGSEVIADIDGQRFPMFINTNGAWVRDAGDEQRLLNAMRSGRSLVVSGKSARGTATRYTFSLSGVTASTNRMRQECS